LVMTSCVGTSIVMVRRSTRCALSTPGITKVMPGPRGPTRRPRRNTTRRSYSRTTFSPLAARASRTRTRAMLPGMVQLLLFAPRRLVRRADAQSQAVDGDDFDRVVAFDRRVACCRPVLAAHQHHALRIEALAHDADGAQHPFAAADRPAALRLEDERADDDAD